ncbi:MAG TPA: methylenetetrahydrofolate reductase C-terminal domain-containing protein [Desulfotignum sp.]|jgi:methylenetetrahydrofolate reductase (NADPH)|nr:methylenetetrahydrofolate reductase C-terminal domain-containing protein [Desulfotignum sp.]
MLRIFKDELLNPKNFVVTLELVPGRESKGRNTDTLKGIARDAFADGRVSAVSITDNPGGNPSLSPDVLGSEIFEYGLDVIVHFTCRDLNRVGMESRALQLARMGMKNILALTGDYSGKGFGGQGKPVFDFDSVILTAMLQQLNHRLYASGDPDGFFTGCAVSPFKSTEGETQAQYRKLDKKLMAGASFLITQLGYDVTKFQELMTYLDQRGEHPAVMASVYLLSPRSARAMNNCRVPGAYIGDDLYNRVVREWRDMHTGLKYSIDRAARLGLMLKQMGYRGIHIGGIHRSFQTVAAILDRMDELEKQGQDLRVPEFATETTNVTALCTPAAGPASRGRLLARISENLTEHLPYRALRAVHGVFFEKSSRLAPVCRWGAQRVDRNNFAKRMFKRLLEDPVKVPLLSCQGCGDCAIQHVAFLCPESGCPKHTRNGACGGSRDGFCEVNTDRLCVWVRAYIRLKHCNKAHTLARDFVPPRMWELNGTSSWINFHLGRDHQKKK